MKESNKDLSALILRMQNFDESQSFQGYPTMIDTDDQLIYASIESTCGKSESSSAVHVAYVASEYCTTKVHYENAQRYYLAMLESIWDCNMSEGNNSYYAELYYAD